MDSSDAANIRGCRVIKYILFVMARYPLFSRRYIREHIERPDTKPSELANYKSNLVDSKRCLSAILMSFYLWNYIKNSYIAYLWLHSFNFSQLEDNLRPLELSEEQLISMNYSLPSDTLTRISCMVTNCTRLSPLSDDPADGHDFGMNPTQEQRLLADFSHLPVFALCNPREDIFLYTPITRLNAFGILIFMVVIYAHFLLGSWTSIQQMLLPAYDDLLMFITSPQVTTRVVERRSRELLRDLACSYHNFCLSLLSNNSRSIALKSLQINADSSDIWSLRNRTQVFDVANRRPDPVKLEAAHISMDERRLNYSSEFRKGPPLAGSSALDSYFGAKTEAQMKASEANCLPIIYTQWWRLRAASIMYNTVRLCILFVIEVCLSSLLFVGFYLDRKRELFQKFHHEMEQMHCFIWPETVSSFEREQAFRVTETRLNWTVLSLINAAALTMLAAITILIMFSQLWTGLMSVSVWLAELRMFLVASLLVTRHQYQRERLWAERSMKSAAGASERVLIRYSLIGNCHQMVGSLKSFYNIANLRKHFQASTRLFLVIIYQRVPSAGEPNTRSSHPPTHWHILNSRANDRDHETHFQAQILGPQSIERSDRRPESALKVSHDYETDYDINTLEEIYINCRLLVEYIRTMQMLTSLVVVISYLLNYGYVFIGIILRRKFSTIDPESSFIIMFAFTISSFVIFLCASFHANAKQLQALLYSLIAQLTYSKDLRVQHMRSLWIRQTAMMDGEGGLALSTYGFRITYVYIIQLVIGTATVLVLALKP